MCLGSGERVGRVGSTRDLDGQAERREGPDSAQAREAPHDRRPLPRGGQLHDRPIKAIASGANPEDCGISLIERDRQTTLGEGVRAQRRLARQGPCVCGVDQALAKEQCHNR